VLVGYVNWSVIENVVDGKGNQVNAPESLSVERRELCENHDTRFELRRNKTPPFPLAIRSSGWWVEKMTSIDSVLRS
jgi:hypothetical protein